MAKSGWTTISLPSKMLDSLDEFVKTGEAEKLGLMNKSQTIALLVRYFLNGKINLSSEFNNNELLILEKLKKIEGGLNESQKKINEHSSKISTILEFQDNHDELLDKIIQNNELDKKIEKVSKIQVVDVIENNDENLTYKVKLLDKNIGEIIEVIRDINGEFCSYHKSSSCNHVKFVLSDWDLWNLLEERGIDKKIK